MTSQVLQFAEIIIHFLNPLLNLSILRPNGHGNRVSTA